MRRFSAYSSAQFKRSVRFLPFIFLVTLIICICLALFLVTSLNVGASDNEDSQRKIRIGITGSFEDTFLGFGLSAIQTFDSSRFALELVECSEAEAAASLRRGDISGYVVIPDGFIDDAIHGDVGKLQFVANYVNADIVNMLKQEILDLVSCIIVECQKGVYAMQEVLDQFGASYDEIDTETLALSADYISVILARSNALDVKIVEAQKSLTFKGHMFSGITILLMLLSGIVTCPLFVRRDISLYRLLSANRHSAASQILGEYLAFFFMMLINNVILIFVLMIGTGPMLGAIPELELLEISDILLLVVKCVPVILLITSLQFLMYQLSDSIVSGVLMQFFSAVLLGYLSGCFYPISFFPEGIRTVAGIIPPGISVQYLSSLLMGRTDGSNIVSIMLYFAAFTILSVLVRYNKIKKA